MPWELLPEFISDFFLFISWRLWFCTPAIFLKFIYIYLYIFIIFYNYLYPGGCDSVLQPFVFLNIYPGGCDSVLQPCPLILRKCSKSWAVFWSLLLGLYVGSHSTGTSQTIFSAKPCVGISLWCERNIWKRSPSSRMWPMKMFPRMDCPGFRWRSAVSTEHLFGVSKGVAACLWLSACLFKFFGHTQPIQISEVTSGILLFVL